MKIFCKFITLCISLGSPETQNQEKPCRDTCKRSFIIGFGSHAMEARKSHNLLSASWGTRKARSVVQSECKGLRTWGVDVFKSKNLKAQDTGSPTSEGRRIWMSHLKKRE